MKKFAMLFVCILFCGCTTPKKYVADTSLIDLWRDVKNREPYPFPYLSIYKNANKTLMFLADSHGTQKEGFQIIREIFYSNPPDVLIVEGIEYKDSFSPKHTIKTIDEEMLYCRQEGDYAINLALRNSIPFIGAEITNIDLLNTVIKNGYTLIDFQVYKIIRYLDIKHQPGIIREGGVSFENYLSWFKNAFSIDHETDFMKNKEEFLKVFKEKYGKSYRKDIDYKESNFDRKLSDLISKIRNTHISQVIADMLNKFDKVLVVYGAGHRMELARVLEYMLKKPAFKTFGPDVVFTPVKEQETINKKCNETGCNYGVVRQSFKNGIDFHIEKRSNVYYVRHYRIMRTFEKEHFLKEYKFDTLKEVNGHLKGYF